MTNTIELARGELVERKLISIPIESPYGVVGEKLEVHWRIRGRVYSLAYQVPNEEKVVVVDQETEEMVFIEFPLDEIKEPAKELSRAVQLCVGFTIVLMAVGSICSIVFVVKLAWYLLSKVF